ncbi:hypothetical protein QG516_03805 [Pedobacter gandavensis]|uniref:hypothetical protein n=1 Tax=Pedobacter gandavensis TaxID=2679963 RepID=UPI002478FA90|nr:hypothetical protein [Pedobacter gandavensis]WGQ10778.1 hypothetical protein QG516_03805 [Pedobacter gandavensis]
MNEGTVSILNWVEDNIHPQKLTNSVLTEADIKSLNEGFKAEVKSFRKTVFKQLIFFKKEASNNMKQLVTISDSIHHYLNRMAPAWNQNISAPQIKSIYIDMLNSLEIQLEDMARLAPKIHRKIPVTRYSLPQLMMGLKEQYRVFTGRLDNEAVDENLKTILQKGLFQLAHKKEITLLNADYCRHLMNAIISSDNLDTQSIRVLLLLNGFNLPEFYYYCISEYRDALDNISGLHEQLAMLMTEQDKLKNLPRVIKTNMLPGVVPIGEQLEGFLSEKKHHISEMLKLRRVILQDDMLAKSMTRLKINMPVAQFGLFIRVQVEKGLLLKENIGELFNFFAAHFYTPQTMFISPESLRKKSTDVEFSTAQKLKAHLIGMLNWLNENYNLSNYKGS